MEGKAARSVASHGWIALMLAIGALLLPAAAQAAPPTLNSAGHSSRHLTASWTLPPGMASDFIEASTSPATDADGYFLSAVLAEYVPDTATTYFSPTQLLVGTYFVHVAAYDPVVCAPEPPPAECVDEFSSTLAVTIPPDPPPPPPPPPAPPVVADAITAFSALSAKSKQDVDKLFVRAAMGESGTITGTGTVSVPGASKVFKFKAVTATAASGASVKLKFKLPSKALKAVKKALRKKKKLKAKLTITAKDKTGNTKAQKRTVALKD